MKSGRQRRAEIIAKRIKRAARRAAMVKAAELEANPSRFVPVNDTLLGPYNSYGVPDFVSRGYYIDLPFPCVDCGEDQIWTGSQQKSWYEVAKDTFTPPPFAVAPAGAKSASAGRTRGDFI